MMAEEQEAAEHLRELVQIYRREGVVRYDPVTGIRDMVNNIGFLLCAVGRIDYMERTAERIAEDKGEDDAARDAARRILGWST